MLMYNRCWFLITPDDSVTTNPAQLPFPIRTECPPGACVCERELLLADPGGDFRPLRLTRQEELKLIGRIERIASYEDLKHVQALIEAHLGAVLRIEPGPNEVKTVRGIVIVLEDRPGLCKKVRQSVPAAVRRFLDRNPDITFRLLDAHGLLGS
ncbi:MAG: hypothetical protein ACJ8LG_19045 [Massilia sp.]